MKLLEDVLVIDFSQFLSGPSAGLRLADLGARVIKIEKSGTPPRTFANVGKALSRRDLRK